MSVDAGTHEVGEYLRQLGQAEGSVSFSLPAALQRLFAMEMPLGHILLSGVRRRNGHGG